MFNRKMLIVAILSLVYLNPAKASLNCSTQPTCESLGYTMESDANCAEDGYVYCPFDAKYKKCVRPVIKQDAFCANFNLSSCPANAQCYKCESPNGALYLFKGCEDGYLQQEYSCVKTYQTCVEAGLWDEGSEETCAGTIEITLPDATTKVCYYDCCEYIDEQACEAATANINSECTLKDGCYLPTDCKEGFYKEANDTNCSGGLYNTLSGIDANGCGYCATEFTSCEEAGYSSEPIANGVSKPIYTSSGRLQTFCVAPSNEDACREAFFNANCVKDEDGGYKANGCKQEVTSCEEGYVLVTDLAGCKGCKKDCEFDDLSACESAEKNANTTCKEDEEGCFVADTKCKTGFISDVALCEGEYLTAGLKDTDANGCGTCYESNCDYKTGDECQSKYTNSKCEETSTGGCFVPTGCKDGFYKEANGTNCAEGIYTELGGVDEYGCGYCATKFTSCEEAGYSSEPIANGKQVSVYLSDGSKARCMAPVDKDACTDAFFNSKCVDDGNGNYKADGCLQESVSSCEEGYQKITDAAGCSACKAVCEYYDEATCTQKNANSVCEPDTKGCYIATGCKANYYKEANSANCTQGEFSTLGGVDAYGCGYCATAHSTCEEAGYFTTNNACTDLSPEPWSVYASDGTVMSCVSCGSPKCAESEKSNSRCEAAYTNSICSQADDGCYKPTECKANYYKEANEATCGNLAEYIYTTISGADAYGCGYCASTYSTCEQAGYYTDAEACSVLNNPKVLYLTDGKETICQDCKSISCQYNDKAECESENANSECTESKYHEGCYAPTKCLENYATSCDEGYTLTEADAYGCGTCKKNCEYANESACESANFNSDCTDVDGCYLPTGCTYGAAKEFNSSDLSSCMMGGRYYATKLVNIDPAGCGRCGTNYDSCDQLGYLVGAHTGDGYDSSTGREFLFLSSQGQPRDCWILNDTCPYDTLSDCQATGGSCIYNMGCYEAKSCASGYTLTDGKCVANTSATTCEDIATGSDYMKYGTGMSCPSGFDIGGPAQIDGMVCTECCKYAGQMSCENANTGTVCERVANTGCFAPSTTCKDGYTLQNGKCVASGSSGGDGHSGGSDDSGSTVTCTYTSASACQGVYTKSTCTADSNGCYNPSACASGYAKSCSSGYSLTSTDSYGCGTCKKNCTYTSASACQAVYTKSTCTQDSDGCYNPSACASGYTKSCSGGTLSGTDGYGCGTCVTDSCTVTTYPAFTTALANSSCTTVTLAANIDGSTDDTSTPYNLTVSNKTLNGAGYTLKLKKSLVPYNKATIKNLTIVNNERPAIDLTDYNTPIVLNNINIETTNIAIRANETTGANMTGVNTIKVSGTEGVGLIFSEMGDFKLASGATLDIIATNGAVGVAAGMSMPFYVDGTLNIDVTDGYAMKGMAGPGIVDINGNLNINHSGTQNPIYYEDQALRMVVSEGAKVKIVTNSTDTTIKYSESGYNTFTIGGTVEIEAPIANDKYFMASNVNLRFTSANAKLITKSTGSRVLSDTDAGINAMFNNAVVGATWDVTGTGYSKNWKCYEDYSDNTTITTYPPSPYWCDAVKGCSTCITDKTVCESNVENSYCYKDGQSCYVLSCKSGYRLKDGACVAFETCEEGGMLTSTTGLSCPGSLIGGLKDAFSYENTLYTGSCSYCCPYNTLEKCQTANPGATCENTGAFPAMSSLFGTCYEPTSCPAGQEIVDWKCVASGATCEYADQAACESVVSGSTCSLNSATNCYEATDCGNNYVYFLKNGTCDCFRTSSECEQSVTGASCTEVLGDSKGDCYAVVSCNTGYKLTGDYKCEACTYADEAECENTNANSDCTNVDGCYELTGCKSGYTLTDGVCVANTSATTCENISTGSEYVKYATGMSCPSGFSLGGPEQIDGMVCSICCKYAGQMSCENANTGTVCEYVANTGCFAPSNNCQDGYTFQNGKCISTSGVCEYTSQSACENANPGFKCKEEGTSSSGNSHSGG